MTLSHANSTRVACRTSDNAASMTPCDTHGHPSHSKQTSQMMTSTQAGLHSADLLGELRGLIEQARQQVAYAANSALTLLYWRVGERIRREVLKEGRAEYREQIVSTLSTQLEPEYGQGFGLRSLRRMVQFAEVFPDVQIVAPLAQTLSWSHFIEILPLTAPLEREYYAELCRLERWSVRTLRERIGSQLDLRTAIAKKPATLPATRLRLESAIVTPTDLAQVTAQGYSQQHWQDRHVFCMQDQNANGEPAFINPVMALVFKQNQPQSLMQQANAAIFMKATPN